MLDLSKSEKVESIVIYDYFKEKQDNENIKKIENEVNRNGK